MSQNVFSIIPDGYTKECNYLYNFLSSVKDLPYVGKDEDDTLEAMLYETAFALMCEEYLNCVAEMPKHDDLEYLIEEIGFAEEEEEMDWFFEKYLEEKSNDGFEENMFLLLEEYKKKIATSIFNFFGTEDKVKLFFASIFTMDRQGHVPHGFDAALSSDGFVNDLKLMVK